MRKQIELEVPTTMNDITLGQYQKYIKVADENEGADEFVNKKLIEIFCNITLRDVEQIPMVEAEKVISILGKAFEEKPELIRHFKLLDVEMGFIPKLDDISLGEYIDLENTISDWQNIHKAMAVLFRPVNFKSKDKYTIAPYSPNEDIQSLMKEMPLDVVMGAMVFFLRFRERVVDSYPELYGTGDEEATTDLTAQGSFSSKWGWYQSIYALAKGDVLKFDEVTSQGLYKCLNYLVFEKEKNQLEAQMIKNAYKK